MKAVVIAGGMAHRYVAGKHVDKALIPDDATGDQVREIIEDFRVNGLPEIVDPPAAPREPCEVAFDRIVSELELVRMTPRQTDEVAE
jgi:hypothetical protein